MSAMRAKLRGGALLLALCAAPARALPPPPPPVSSVALLIARGDAALSAGDSISAIGYYRDAVSRAPRDARGYLALGQAYLRVGEPAHALEAFDVGARNTQGSDELLVGLARAQAALGRDAQALATLRGALARGGSPSPLLLEALAEAAEHAGAFTEALAARRALLARAREGGAADAAELRALETRVSALELLLGGAERLGRARCGEAELGAVLRALLGC